MKIASTRLLIVADIGMNYRVQISALASSGPGSAIVQCGRHAVDLAEELMRVIGEQRAAIGFAGRVHLFLAVPNGFAFFLGQRLKPAGKVVIYEYDFEGQNGGSYEPSLALPVGERSHSPHPVKSREI